MGSCTEQNFYLFIMLFLTFGVTMVVVTSVARTWASRLFKAEFEFKYGSLSEQEKEQLYPMQCEMYGFEALEDR
jgi:hypothetical protein